MPIAAPSLAGKRSTLTVFEQVSSLFSALHEIFTRHTITLVPSANPYVVRGHSTSCWPAAALGSRPTLHSFDDVISPPCIDIAIASSTLSERDNAKRNNDVATQPTPLSSSSSLREFRRGRKKHRCEYSFLSLYSLFPLFAGRTSQRKFRSIFFA